MTSASALILQKLEDVVARLERIEKVVSHDTMLVQDSKPEGPKPFEYTVTVLGKKDVTTEFIQRMCGTESNMLPIVDGIEVTVKHFIFDYMAVEALDLSSHNADIFIFVGSRDLICNVHTIRRVDPSQCCILLYTGVEFNEKDLRRIFPMCITHVSMCDTAWNTQTLIDSTKDLKTLLEEDKQQPGKWSKINTPEVVILTGYEAKNLDYFKSNSFVSKVCDPVSGSEWEVREMTCGTKTHNVEHTLWKIGALTNLAVERLKINVHRNSEYLINVYRKDEEKGKPPVFDVMWDGDRIFQTFHV